MQQRVDHARSAGWEDIRCKQVRAVLRHAHSTDVLNNEVKTDKVTAQDESNRNRWGLERELEAASRLGEGVSESSKYWSWLFGRPRQPFFCS